LRAFAVAGAWAASAAPWLVAPPRCPIALVFHVPCPGCGMTRALRLLADGNLHASLRMHPLALPVLVALATLVTATVWATMQAGSPVRMHRTRFGRAALGLAAIVYGAALMVWVARWFGWFGGPVPI
jgi:hypothetical protein